MPRLVAYTPQEVERILRQSESEVRGGGHTLRRHVTISNPALIRRVNEDTEDGGVANYGAFLEGRVQEAAILGAWLLNSPGGAFALNFLDEGTERVRDRGNPLVPGDYPVQTLQGVAPTGWFMRWVQAGTAVVRVPLGSLRMVVRAAKGGTIEVVTFFPIFDGGTGVTMTTLYRAR